MSLRDEVLKLAEECEGYAETFARCSADMAAKGYTGTNFDGAWASHDALAKKLRAALAAAPASPQGERERALEEALRKAKLELEFRYAQIEDCEGALTPEGWRDYQARRTARATASSPHYAEKED